MPAAGTRTSSSMIWVSGSPRPPRCRVLPPVAVAPGRRGRGDAGCACCRPPGRRRRGHARRGRAGRSGLLVASRSLCFRSSLPLSLRSSCLRSSCLRSSCLRSSLRLSSGCRLLRRPAVRLVLLVASRLVLRSRAGRSCVGGCARGALADARLAAAWLAPWRLPPTGAPDCRRLAAGLSPGLGGLDRVDQLGLLHRARARDAQAAGHRLEVGEQHGVESAGALLGRRVAACESRVSVT